MHLIRKLAVPIVLLSQACAHPDAPKPPERIDGVTAQSEWRALCRVWGPAGPADRAGIEDTPSGAAINLTTDGDNLSELRNRVRQAFRQQSPGDSPPVSSQGRAMASGGGMNAVVVSDTATGVQIRFVAPSRSQIEDVRRQTRLHYMNLSSGGCR